MIAAKLNLPDECILPSAKPAPDVSLRLKRALDALELAESIMSFSRGDAYEREATEHDYSAFREIYLELFPPAPLPINRAFTKNRPDPKLPCPTCGRQYRGTKGTYDHSRTMHAYGGSHQEFRKEFRGFFTASQKTGC